MSGSSQVDARIRLPGHVRWHHSERVRHRRKSRSKDQAPPRLDGSSDRANGDLKHGTLLARSARLHTARLLAAGVVADETKLRERRSYDRDHGAAAFCDSVGFCGSRVTRPISLT